MTGRDYVSEMRAIVDAETAHGAYISRAVAATVVEKLRVNDVELLDGWLYQQAEQFVWQMINDRDRSTRSHARQTSGRSTFADDAKKHAEGNSVPLVRWLTVPFAVADGTRKQLGTMTAEDLLFVADTYDARAVQNRMTAAFMRAIARKVEKDKVTADFFTDKALDVMWRSITGGQ